MQVVAPTLSESPHSTHSRTAHSAVPSTKPSISEIWTELAGLTIQAFSPDLINQLHSFISRTPDFDSDIHLKMLGAIVVRHVSKSLHLHSNHIKSSSTPSIQPPPVKNLPTSRRNSRTYRDLAYHAVRMNRILPQSVPVNNVAAKSATATTVRRLSIHVPKQASTPQIHASSSPTISPNTLVVESKLETSHMQHSHHPSTPLKRSSVELPSRLVLGSSSDSPTVRRMHTSAFWRSGKEKTFPRADVTSCIATSEQRPTRIDAVLEDINNCPTVSRQPRMLPKTDLNVPSLTNRLANLRRQRLERKKHK